MTAEQVMRRALEEIIANYDRIKGAPPVWVDLSGSQLSLAREAWYGAMLIARRALSAIEQD